MIKQSKHSSYKILKTLKIDIFGTIYLATYQNQTVIIRDLEIKNKLYKIVAKYLNFNEVRILKKINKLYSPNFPQLIKSTSDYTIRSYISGTPINRYPKKLNEAFYDKALNLVKTLHRNGIVHNDLEKSENWIVMDNGEPAFIDFQLSKYFSRKTYIFQLLKKIELRHIIKSKKKYCIASLNESELKILKNKNIIHKLVRILIKPIYNFVTRRILNYSDRKSDQYF